MIQMYSIYLSHVSLLTIPRAVCHYVVWLDFKLSGGNEMPKRIAQCSFEKIVLLFRRHILKSSDMQIACIGRPITQNGNDNSSCKQSVFWLITACTRIKCTAGTFKRRLVIFVHRLHRFTPPQPPVGHFSRRAHFSAAAKPVHRLHCIWWFKSRSVIFSENLLTQFSWLVLVLQNPWHWMLFFSLFYEVHPHL